MPDKNIPAFPNELEIRRQSWLTLARELLWELFNRARLLEQLHPRRNCSEEKADQCADEISDCESTIKSLCKKLDQLESEPPAFGVIALLNLKGRCPAVLRSAVIALALSRLSTMFDGYADTVGEVAALAAGDDAVEALGLRNAFRENGVLRESVHLERRGANIDSLKISLTETGLCTVLGEIPDTEQLAISAFRNIPDMRKR